MSFPSLNDFNKPGIINPSINVFPTVAEPKVDVNSAVVEFNDSNFKLLVEDTTQIEIKYDPYTGKQLPEPQIKNVKKPFEPDIELAGSTECTVVLFYDDKSLDAYAEYKINSSKISTKRFAAANLSGGKGLDKVINYLSAHQLKYYNNQLPYVVIYTNGKAVASYVNPAQILAVVSMNTCLPPRNDSTPNVEDLSNVFSGNVDFNDDLITRINKHNLDSQIIRAICNGNNYNSFYNLVLQLLPKYSAVRIYYNFTNWKLFITALYIDYNINKYGTPAQNYLEEIFSVMQNMHNKNEADTYYDKYIMSLYYHGINPRYISFLRNL